MPQLLLTLPSAHALAHPGSAEFDYLLLADNQQPVSQGSAVAALLPSASGRGGEVVAVLPPDALSWHRMALPERVGRSLLAGRMEPERVRAVVVGVLEEQLLDDADRLHLACFADTAQAPEGQVALWVAACQRSWLRDALLVLDGAGCTVSRIVAQCTPLSQSGTQVVVCAGMEPAQMVLCTASGVAVMPLVPAAVAYAQAQGQAELLAEPAVLERAEQALGLRATLQTPAQRCVVAAQSSWNLAQGEFSPARVRKRMARRAAAAWAQWLHAPAWRPARWGLLVLVLAQVAGLNALAWQQKNQMAQRRASLNSILTQTFPDVQVVVDAPVQMKRGIDALALARGMGGGPDIARMLAAVGQLGAGAVLQSVDVEGQTLRVQFSGTDDQLAIRVAASLQAQGWQAAVRDGTIQIQAREVD